MLIRQTLITATFFFMMLSAQASENCFIAKENGKIIKQIGQCDTPHSPYSTFKIPLAIIGFDSGILKTTDDPRIAFSKSIKDRVGDLYNPQRYPVMIFWSRDQTPSTWMKYSVVWYSQEITQRLGMKKFQHYVEQLHYGNIDVSGTPGKNNGLRTAWIDSSLKISPREMVDFIEKLSTENLPLSKQAQEKTKKIIALENLWDDWKLYGKTGGSMKNGWFVGWIENGDRRISFAQYIDVSNSLISAGRLAKEVAKDNLLNSTFELKSSS